MWDIMETTSSKSEQEYTFEQYMQIYKNERDSALLKYFKDSVGEKRRALAYLLYMRGYKNFGYQ